MKKLPHSLFSAILTGLVCILPVTRPITIKLLPLIMVAIGSLPLFINAARAQQQAAIYAQKQQQASYYKQLSLQRSGDTRFPVCNAASPDNGLDITTNSWYGSNCRAR